MTWEGGLSFQTILLWPGLPSLHRHLFHLSDSVAAAFLTSLSFTPSFHHHVSSLDCAITDVSLLICSWVDAWATQVCTRLTFTVSGIAARLSDRKPVISSQPFMAMRFISTWGRSFIIVCKPAKLSGLELDTH